MISSKSTSPRPRERKVPAASGLAEVEVGGKDAGASVEGDDGVFHVDMEDAVGEFFNELYGGRSPASAGGWGRS